MRSGLLVTCALLCGCGENTAKKPIRPTESATTASTKPAATLPPITATAKPEPPAVPTVPESQNAPEPTTRKSAVPSKNTIDDLFLFHPSKHPTGNWHPTGLNFKDVWIKSKDGTRIHAWYCPAEKPRAHVLYAHGNAGNISHRATLLARLQRMGISTLAFDYRGYGRSDGLPSKSGVIEDAEAAWVHLAALAEVKDSDIVLMGRSLGGAVVAQLAAKKPPKGLIIESSFSSLADVAKHLLPRLAWLVNRQSLNTVAVLPQYRGPVLISHGRDDKTIPFSQGQSLFKAANQPKQFFAIPRGGHNSPQPAEYYDVLKRFIGDL